MRHLRCNWIHVGLLLVTVCLAGVVCLAAFPSDKFKVDCRVREPQFHITAHKDETPTWIFATYQGETNPLDTTWSAAGYTMVLKIARSKDASAILCDPITGTVATVETTFVVPTNALTEELTGGHVWLLVYTNARQTVFAEGTIDIRKAPMF